MINHFNGKHRFLSNFYPIVINYEGLEYASAENAYQAAKSDDINVKKTFQWLKASEAKQRGKLVPLCFGFEYAKLEIMLNIVHTKFFSHRHLAQMLIDTGDEYIEEGNWWGDTFWGTVNGLGENHLGKILMRVREELLVIAKAEGKL